MSEFLNTIQNPFFAAILKNFSNPAPYFLILVFLFLAVFFYGMRSGRGRIVLLLLSLYIAIVLTNFFPYENQLVINFDVKEPFFLKAVLFLITVLVSFNLLLHSSLRSLAVREHGKNPILQILVLTVLTVGIFVSSLTTFLPQEYLNNLNHPIFKYFTTQNAQFWWGLAGIVFLALIRRKRFPKA